ncbi:MAG: FixG Ig-like domain-containing protein [Burkholderiaceae bacterium]|nr:FixG Ig-like domain-containing protein [Burkholderiaceae bacterium]
MRDPAAASAGAAAPPSGQPDAKGLVGDDAVVAVVSLYQKQKKIYARAVSGLFATWRWSLVWFTQILFYGLPWLEWNQRQLVLFDLGARRFYIGPLVLYPQDFIFLTGILIISAYALFLFTAVAGRLWCGYACPQTVYTEIFMWVERKIEGDRIARMRLDDGPWTLNKLWRKSAKQVAWIVMGLWTGLTFVGYFTPIKTLVASAASLGLGPWEWFWVLFYGMATYGNAGFMREQVCKYMCPYARFQSAMFDKDTLIISYDTERGEPRGSRSRKADPGKLGLGACIDVCDGVMDKMGYARGLVRYDTQNGLAQHLTPRQRLARIFRPRVLVYTSILGIILLGFFIALAMRHPFKVDVVRDRASLARLVDNGQIENVFRLQIMNATEQPQHYRVAVQGLPGITLEALPELALAPAEARWVTVSARIPAEAAQQAGAGAHAIQFQIGLLTTDAAGQPKTDLALSEKSTFVVPR